MTGAEVEVLGVTGGSHGLAAAYVAVRGLADRYDRAGDRLRGWAGTGRRTLLDEDLLASAVLAPATFAEAEVRVLAATTGPDGVLVASAAWEADAVLVRAAVSALVETDEQARAAFEVLDHLAGRALGATLPVVAPVALVGLLPLTPALAPAVAPVLGPALDDLVAEHPGAVEHLVNGSGGLLDGLWDGLAPLAPGGPFGLDSSTPDTQAAAAVLAAAYGDPGTGVAIPLGPPVTGEPAADLAGLLGHLDRLHTTGADGTIEVQTLTAADGSVRHVVHLPGTDDLTTLPWTRDGDARDLHTNLLLVAGLENPYQQGVLDAMTQAGVAADEPVLVVGHSQGGMVAAAVLAQGGPFSVTDVVTAGSPTAHLEAFPPGSHVLSLEHRGDVVPLLDGEANRDTPQQTTVHFDHGAAGLVDAHSIAHHSAAAAALEAAVLAGTAHPSVADALERLHERGYLGSGSTVTSQVFCVVRAP